MIALLSLVCRAFLGRETSEGQQADGISLTRDETQVVREGAYLSTRHSEVPCDSDIF